MMIIIIINLYGSCAKTKVINYFLYRKSRYIVIMKTKILHEFDEFTCYGFNSIYYKSQSFKIVWNTILKTKGCLI